MKTSQELYDFAKELLLDVYDLAFDEYNDKEIREIITIHLSRKHYILPTEYISYYIKCDDENNNEEVLERNGIVVELYLLHRFDDIHDILSISADNEGMFVYLNGILILKNV